MGIALEGSENVWPGTVEAAVLPSFDVFNRQERYLEIFNKGSHLFSFSITCDKPWILLKETAGSIITEKRIAVNIDWEKIPTHSKIMKAVFAGLNFVKIPFPAIEVNSKGNIKGYWLYF